MPAVTESHDESIREKTPAHSLAERIIFAAGLEPRRLKPRSAPGELARIAARALRLAVPIELSDRDRRLLHDAEAAAPLTEDAPPTEAFVLIALACAGWAATLERSLRERDASLVACVALSLLVPVAARSPLLARLAGLSTREELCARSRAAAGRISTGKETTESDLARVLADALERIDAG